LIRGYLWVQQGAGNLTLRFQLSQKRRDGEILASRCGKDLEREEGDLL